MDKHEDGEGSTGRGDVAPASLREVAGCYLRLGTTAFGGPAAHIAFMRSELVVRRRWVGEAEMLDLIGAASVLPGPTSTEVAMMLARRRRGWAGLLVGGICFILPSAVLVVLITWAYVRYGTTRLGNGLLFGIRPVVLAIIADAVVSLARSAVKRPWLLVVVIGALGVYLLGADPLAVLAGAAVAAVAVEYRGELGVGRASALPVVATPARLAVASRTGPLRRVPLSAVFLEFLKLGSVVFGSGYVLVSYLRGDLVVSGHWLTASELLATVAIGQMTPGPVFTTATSIGYVVAGLPGAVLATVGIFLPSFVLVFALFPVLGRVRSARWSSAGLDGVNAAAVGLMAGVAVQLARSSYGGWLTVAEFLLSLAVLVRLRPNTTWLVLAGALVGALHVFA